MEIYTTKGQFLKLRPGSDISQSQHNFIQEYCHNLKLFDGFIVGWNDNNINYIEFLNREISQIPLEIQESISKKLDTTKNTNLYYNKSCHRSIYKTNLYGQGNQESVIEDDYKRLFAQNKGAIISISCVIVYYDKYINCIEVEYQDFSSNDKFKICHIGSNSKFYNP